MLPTIDELRLERDLNVLRANLHEEALVLALADCQHGINTTVRNQRLGPGPVHESVCLLCGSLKAITFRDDYGEPPRKATRAEGVWRLPLTVKKSLRGLINSVEQDRLQLALDLDWSDL